MGCSGSHEQETAGYDVERKSIPITKIESWKSSKSLTVEEIIRMRKVI